MESRISAHLNSAMRVSWAQKERLITSIGHQDMLKEESDRCKAVLDKVSEEERVCAAAIAKLTADSAVAKNAISPLEIRLADLL